MDNKVTEWWIKKLTNAWEKEEYVNYAQLMFQAYLKLDNQEITKVLSEVRDNQIDYGYAINEYGSGEGI